MMLDFLHKLNSSSSRTRLVMGIFGGCSTMTTSNPVRSETCGEASIARTCRFSRLRTTAGRTPRRVRNPTRVAGSPVGSAPTDSARPRAHRPRR